MHYKLPSKWNNILHKGWRVNASWPLDLRYYCPGSESKAKVSGALLVYRGTPPVLVPPVTFIHPHLMFLQNHIVILFWTCVLFRISLFVCTYNKTCLKCLKSEAEYRIEMILYSSWPLILFCFPHLFFSFSVDIWCCNVGKKRKCKILYHLWNMYKREM